MADSGGFCEKHGPFDPPNRTCPYCALEEEQRRAYGPPAEVIPVPEPPTGAESPATGFQRRTVEPGPRTDVTEVVPRRAAPDAAEEAPVSPERPPLGWLVVKEPVERRGAILPIRANQIIGRSGDVQWDDPRMSRQHARLTYEPAPDQPDAPPVFHLWPFGPANPVYINDQEIRGATPLRENDVIRLGSTLFVFKLLVD